eukprot:CAMPEP_0185829238 /NCGR_PEP_ID=MMETSP1353-20130828/130_1 /TAXON_ID=1077150 /ORGANISM="Erythrolobus australicus, Strain CCMP3124" /LENGTH=78 /DNA_ID=CAMNT_0028527003 /DNA_START=40 /DNA_END=276 /DNA_ORIENTATION=+
METVELQSWAENMQSYEAAYQMHYAGMVAQATLARHQSSGATPPLLKRKSPEACSPSLVQQFACVETPFKSPRFEERR